MPPTTEEFSNSGFSRENYFKRRDQMLAAEQKVKDAITERKELRRILRGEGFNLSAYDDTQKALRKAGELRDEKDRQFRQMMVWEGKPLNFQGSMEFGDSPEMPELSEIEVERIKAGARAYAMQGKPAHLNPESPGTDRYDIWLEWYRTFLAELENDKNGHKADQQQKHGRGRPRRTAAAPPPPVEPAVTGRRRGRPKRNTDAAALH